MIEQTQEEVAEAMRDDPEYWAEMYLDLMTLVKELSQANKQLALAAFPIANVKRMH